METNIRTPQQVFAMPERLVVPYFQRPYVWTAPLQWAPLWADVANVADRQLAGESAPPHFLGAVVLQAAPQAIGSMTERTVIDGQQRLTTLQLLIDAVHAVLVEAGQQMPAARLEALVTNGIAFRTVEDDRHKVWPTKRDRASFFAVMAAEPPLDYAALGVASRLVQAHRFFHAEATRWLHVSDDGGSGREDGEGSGAALAQRASSLADTISQRLAMVVIELSAEENAQEIFETLNARGTRLTPADLVKNFIFQQLAAQGGDIEAAYGSYWQPFEAPFWEAEVSAGRVKQQRASLFITQWLIAQTGTEILERRVFETFKTVAQASAEPMLTLLQRLAASAERYRRFVESASTPSDRPDRLELFAYRTSALESEAVRPLVIHLQDPALPPVPADQLAKALAVVESWLVRRMLLRRTAASYTQVVAALIGHLREQPRDVAGNQTEAFIQAQPAFNWYWPDDRELREHLQGFDAYRRLSRARLRMVLEALEDARRGVDAAKPGMAGQRVVRGQYAIEHVLPQKWETHWPLEDDEDAARRTDLVHTLGNLTLLMTALNSKVSNGPWGGPTGKRAALEQHDILMLNRDLLKDAVEAWTEDAIEERTTQLVNRLLQVWPVPEGHEWAEDDEDDAPQRRVRISDLMDAGLLDAGTVLHAKPARARGAVAVVTPEGGLRVGEQVFSSPSGAAKSLSGRSENGWRYWLLDVEQRTDLGTLLGEYLALSVDDADEDDPLEGDLAEEVSET